MDFIKERDEAFTEFIMTGKTKKVMMYCKRWSIPVPKNEVSFAAGIYKASLHCTELPRHVKDIAFKKCIELGFQPYDN